MASGELPWSLGDPLATLVAGTEMRCVTEAVPLPGDRDVVLVVRDPQRHAWQQEMLDAVRGHGRAVVVDCGWPAEAPTVPTVRTRGIAPGLLAAAAAVLAGPAR
jgi:beta-N-acetylhexosaminidase